MLVKYAVKNIVKEEINMPRRGENIYKRKDGRWEGRYIRGHSSSGRAEYGYVYARSYREGRAKRQQRLESLQELPAKTSSLTLNQAAERFLADKQDKLKQSTLARYAYMLEHYILPALGAVLVCQLTANQISDFLRRLQKNGLSGKSARDVGVLLKSILKYSAPKAGCSCPGLTVELPAYRRKQIDIFCPDEVQRLAQKIVVEPTTTGIAILLTLNTGLRLGELCALQYKDIDLQNGVIHVTKTVQRIRSGDRTRLAVLPPKSNSAHRTIPLPLDMATLLKKAVQSHPDGEKYLLTGKNVPMEPRTLQYQYQVLLKATGIPYRNFHVLRHTYASRCVERGVDVKSLSEMLGHTDVRTTLQVYVHSSLEHKMRVIQSICFLAPVLDPDCSPSPSPSDHPEAPRYQQFLTTLSQMG
jgi:integrase